MANEPSATAFVDAVLDACRPIAFKSVVFIAVLDRVSTDGTLERLRDHASREPRLRVVWAPENTCIVDAYVRGYREALVDCDWILEIDSGFSHQPADIPRFIAAMETGADCVFGSRFMAGGSMTGTGLMRQIVSRGGTWLANLLLRTHLHDMTSGFQMFTAPALSAILERGITSRGPFFQTEMKAYCRRLRVVEVPIAYRNASHYIGRAALSDSFSGLWRLYRLRLQGGL